MTVKAAIIALFDKPAAAPQELPDMTEPQTQMPESAIQTAARRLTVEAEKLLPIAAIPRTGPATAGVAMHSLWAQAHGLQIEAQAFGTAEDKVAANAAKAQSECCP